DRSLQGPPTPPIRANEAAAAAAETTTPVQQRGRAPRPGGITRTPGPAGCSGEASRQQPPPPPPGSWNTPALAIPHQTSLLRQGGDTGDPGDDQGCWADWDYPDNAGARLDRGGGRGAGVGRGDRRRGGRSVDDDGDDDEEAAWWSRGPDHRDWSPCSSPTAAAAAAPPPSSSVPTGGGRGGGGEDGREVGAALFRRNPLLPASSCFSRSFASSSPVGALAAFEDEQHQQNQRGSTMSLLSSGLLSGAGVGFTALPRWILRSVRTIGTQ
ncbi:unnamed protein product, partial [Ectocarpus sp. 4 AP-2014]